MLVNLTVLGGVHNGREIPLRAAEFVIGRDPSCNLRPASHEVSRQHCALIQRDGRAFLKDFGSRNGTVVNHRVLAGGELQLADGDLIEVGPLAFRVGLAVGADAVDTQHSIDLTASGVEPSAEDTIQAELRKPAPVPKPADEAERICLEG
jgi:pSer/pThr/pTyr-binding forkhead associated (FHA) protein